MKTKAAPAVQSLLIEAAPVTINIFAVDQSIRNTGWAALCEGKVESGQIPFQAPRKDPFTTAKFAAFWRWFNHSLDLQQPRLVIYEEPICHGQGANQLPLIGLQALLTTACQLRDIPHISVYPSTLKKWATGSGRSEKPAMKSEAKERFPHYVPDEDAGADEADSLLLLSFAMEWAALNAWMFEAPCSDN